MTDSQNKKLMLAIVVLVLGCNVWLLAGVWLNKSDLTASLVLSERELRIPYNYHYDKENTGVSLTLEYRFLSDNEDQFSYGFGNSPEWLDKEKMLSLGFTEKELNPTVYKYVSCEVYVVLELNGAAYKESLRRIKTQYQKELAKLPPVLSAAQKQKHKDMQERLKREEVLSSRLFIIDASQDAEQLQARYGSRKDVFLSRAKLSTRSNYYGRGRQYKTGKIDSLAIEHLYVPHPLNNDIKSLDLRDHNNFQPSRFQAVVNMGSHLVPWIDSVELQTD